MVMPVARSRNEAAPYSLLYIYFATRGEYHSRFARFWQRDEQDFLEKEDAMIH